LGIGNLSNTVSGILLFKKCTEREGENGKSAMPNIPGSVFEWKTDTGDDNVVLCSDTQWAVLFRLTGASKPRFTLNVQDNPMLAYSFQDKTHSFVLLQLKTFVVIDRHTKNWGRCFYFSLSQPPANTRYLAGKRLLKAINNHSIQIPFIFE
jgi:hypothetical protein